MNSPPWSTGPGPNFEDLLAYDRDCFGCDRRRFLELWLFDGAARSFLSRDQGSVTGYAVLRRTGNGGLQGHTGGSLTMLKMIQDHLIDISDAADRAILQRFFKTGPGQYGEGDIFRGIRVPVLRRLSRTYQALPLDQAEALLHSPYHEDRLLSLLILVRRFAAADEPGREEIHRLYLKNMAYINNWDLVDSSAEHIIGAFLDSREKSLLYRLARSPGLWERRTAVLATFCFIKRNRYDDTFGIAEILLSDREDLIHKAVGWMLRETGKRDPAAEESFLKANYRRMPRTMLRYAIERFPEAQRQAYLKGTI